MGKAEDLSRLYVLPFLDEHYEKYGEHQQMKLSRFDGYDMMSAYEEGYHQAEKDLELTWEDIGWIIEEAIDNIPDDLVEKEQICQEVLKRFKERKNNEIQDKVQRPYQQVKAICQ